jgi:hypothetical protein
MKTLLILLFPITIQAQNFMRYDDFKDGLTRGFQLQADCEHGGFECFNADLDKLDEQSVVFDDVDDTTKPRYSTATDITPCDTWQACAKITETLCKQNELALFRYLEETKSYEAYCTKVVGYDQKKKPRITENSEKKQAKQIKRAEREAKRQARATDQARMVELSRQQNLSASEAREVTLWLLKQAVISE